VRHIAIATNFLSDGQHRGIFVALLVLWLLGMMTAYTLGGLIHLLLLMGLIVLLIEFLERYKIMIERRRAGAILAR
jgi:hypothetical protein